MRHRLTIRHISGSRVNQVDCLTMPPEREITFGRGPECDVRFGEADDLVSRKHLKIVATDEQPARYMVVDFGSRNGTFVGRQRVFGAALLLPGGRVQLGAGGPEFEFRPDPEEPRLQPCVAATYSRIAALRGIKQTLIALLLVAAGAAGYVGWARMAPIWRARPHPATKPRFDPAKAFASVAAVEATWRLIDKQTGIRLTRAYIANERLSPAAHFPLVEGASASLPLFILGEDRRIEPVLVAFGATHAAGAVGGNWKSKGVIVSETGALLTAGPLQQPWDLPGQWAVEDTAGALLVVESMRITQVVPLAATQFPRWPPAESGFLAEDLPKDIAGVVRGRRVSNRDLRVEVTAGVGVGGRILESKLTPVSTNLWLGAIQPSSIVAGSYTSLLAGEEAQPKDRQPVWVVGDQIETGEIKHAPVNGPITLSAAGCHEGGVVFDEGGRVLALCVPNNHGTAVPIRPAQILSGGATDGHD